MNTATSKLFDRCVDFANEHSYFKDWGAYATTTTPWLIDKLGKLPQFAQVGAEVKADATAFGKVITLCLFEHELLSAVVHKRPVNFNTYATLCSYIRTHGDVPADTLQLLVNPDLMAWALQKVGAASLQEAMFKMASTAHAADSTALLTDGRAVQ